MPQYILKRPAKIDGVEYQRGEVLPDSVGNPERMIRSGLAEKFLTQDELDAAQEQRRQADARRMEAAMTDSNDAQRRAEELAREAERLATEADSALAGAQGLQAQAATARAAADDARQAALDAQRAATSQPTIPAPMRVNPTSGMPELDQRPATPSQIAAAQDAGEDFQGAGRDIGQDAERVMSAQAISERSQELAGGEGEGVQSTATPPPSPPPTAQEAPRSELEAELKAAPNPPAPKPRPGGRTNQDR